MKLISIDIETTGLNPEKHQILEFGAVMFDTETDKFEPIATFSKIVAQTEIIGEPMALNMNAGLINLISDYNNNKISEQEQDKFCYQNELIKLLKVWLNDNLDYHERNKINVCGKNFWSFDYKFIAKLEYANFIEIRHRSLDPGNLYCESNDIVVPNLSTCKVRAIDKAEKYDIDLDSNVQHTALDDAMDVAKLIWLHFKK